MKVLILINALGVGGAETAVVNLADELIRKGHIVKIVCLSEPILVRPKSNNIELTSLNVESNTDLFKAYFKLRDIVNTFKPHVVHSHLFRANFLARLLKFSLSSPKIICTEHSTSVTSYKRVIAYRLTDALADMNTNVSDAAVECYIKEGAVRKGNMITVKNGVNLSEYCFDEIIRKKTRKALLVQEKKVILAVGRLSPEKDYPNLINAISILNKSRDDFIVFIVGDGSLRENLFSITRSLSLDNVIKFLGSRNDVKNLMQAADVYVMSSLWEGLPMVLLEAMACERTIVATDCGGNRDLVGENGFIVPTQDPERLALAIEEALNMQENERLALGNKSRKHIEENYSLSYNADNYLKLYLS